MVKKKVSNKKVPVSGGMNKNLVVGVVVVLLLVGVFLYFNNQKDVGLSPVTEFDAIAANLDNIGRQVDVLQRQAVGWQAQGSGHTAADIKNLNNQIAGLGRRYQFYLAESGRIAKTWNVKIPAHVDRLIRSVGQSLVRARTAIAGLSVTVGAGIGIISGIVVPSVIGTTITVAGAIIVVGLISALGYYTYTGYQANQIGLTLDEQLVCITGPNTFKTALCVSGIGGTLYQNQRDICQKDGVILYNLAAGIINEDNIHRLFSELSDAESASRLRGFQVTLDQIKRYHEACMALTGPKA